MWVKVLIVLVLLFIVFNLGAGMVYMLTDKGKSDRTLKALTMRIGISIMLFILLLIGMATGLVDYHRSPLGPPASQTSGE
jgi:succinate dehydrogenase/fumarate reductase cytochrome b subunit